MRKQKVFAMVMAAVLSAGTFLAAGGATALTEVRAEETAEKTEGDWSYRVLDDGTAEIRGYDGEATELEIPESLGGVKVTSIGNSAFRFDSLTSVIIPESVTSIKEEAFGYCSSLTSVIIPDSVTSIENSAFANCSSLESVSIPESVTEIGAYVFYGTKWLENKRAENPLVIVNGILIDGETAEGDVKIPEGVTNIGDRAFEDCESLATVTISNGVLSIGDMAFEGCGTLSEINIPASVVKIEINDYDGIAFGHCDSLEKITVDSNNKYYSSYDDCLYNKDKSMLIRCPEMKKEVTVYEVTERIADRAFSYCRFLKSVKLPSAVKNLGWGTFYGCTELESVTLPDSFEGINYNAFGNCEKFNTVKLYENGGNLVLYNGCLYNKDKTKLILVPPAKTDWMLESGLTEIGEGALAFNQAEKTVTVPDTVKKIGCCGFLGCKTDLEFKDNPPEHEYGAFMNAGLILFIPSPEWNDIFRPVDGSYECEDFVFIYETGISGWASKGNIRFTGLFEAVDGNIYYFTDGKLDKSFNGEAEYGGKKYVVENGKAVSEVKDISVNIESAGELSPKLESTGEDALAAVSKLLTEEQLAAVKGGKASLDIKLSVAKIDGSVTPADKELIEKAVESISDGAKLNFKVMNYLDIKLGALIDGKELAVTETAAPLTVSVALEKPAKGNYKVVRIHDGESEILDAELSKDGTRLTFKTDKFSIYAIAYSDVASGDSANTALTVILCLAGLAGIAGLATAAAVQKKRRAA